MCLEHNQPADKQIGSKSIIHIKRHFARRYILTFYLNSRHNCYIKTDKRNNLEKLRTYCIPKILMENLKIPSMSVTEVNRALCQMKQTGTRGLNGIDCNIIRLSAPVITETLTYIFHFLSSYLSCSLADRWCTTVDFTTSFLHSSLFSAFRSAMFH